LEQGDADAIKAVFQTCDVNARGGYRKQTALTFNALSDDLVRWLVAQGADIAATDSQGATPLHACSGHWQGQIAVLLELGAAVDARGQYGDTPLHRAVAVGNRNTAELLLKAGADVDA
jgi:ankyrin repeat protein